MPSSVVSVINYKGGVGKTTLTANLGADLAARGRRVLLIDLDPQASLTFSFFRVPEWETQLAEGRTILQWFDSFLAGGAVDPLRKYVVSPPAVNEVVQPSGGLLDLLASHLGLIEVDLDLAAGLGGARFQRSSPRFLPVHRLLADALNDDAFAGYDAVLIDCAPNFNMVTRNAIVASDDGRGRASPAGGGDQDDDGPDWRPRGGPALPRGRPQAHDSQAEAARVGARHHGDRHEGEDPGRDRGVGRWTAVGLRGHQSRRWRPVGPARCALRSRMAAARWSTSSQSGAGAPPVTAAAISWARRSSASASSVASASGGCAGGTGRGSTVLRGRGSPTHTMSRYRVVRVSAMTSIRCPRSSPATISSGSITTTASNSRPLASWGLTTLTDEPSSSRSALLQTTWLAARASSSSARQACGHTRPTNRPAWAWVIATTTARPARSPASTRWTPGSAGPSRTTINGGTPGAATGRRRAASWYTWRGTRYP